jgi:hypothetical protein
MADERAAYGREDTFLSRYDEKVGEEIDIEGVLVNQALNDRVPGRSRGGMRSDSRSVRYELEPE